MKNELMSGDLANKEGNSNRVEWAVPTNHLLRGISHERNGEIERTHQHDRRALRILRGCFFSTRLCVERQRRITASCGKPFLVKRRSNALFRLSDNEVERCRLSFAWSACRIASCQAEFTISTLVPPSFSGADCGVRANISAWRIAKKTASTFRLMLSLLISGDLFCFSDEIPINIRPNPFATNHPVGFALKIYTKRFADLLAGRYCFSDVPNGRSAVSSERLLFRCVKRV